MKRQIYPKNFQIKTPCGLSKIKPLKYVVLVIDLFLSLDLGCQICLTLKMSSYMNRHDDKCQSVLITSL